MKLSLLNLKVVGEDLIQNQLEQLLTFEEARMMANELSEVDSEDVSEYYFWYVLLFWPNKNEMKSGTCDVEKLLNCINRLQKQNQDRRWITQFRTKKVTKYRDHQPLFYFTDGNGFNRILSEKRFKNEKMIKLPRIKGKFMDNNFKSVEIQISERKTIHVRAEYLAPRVRSGGSDVTFELGFTLEGPLACRIKTDDQESERIQAFGALSLKN